MPADRPRSLTFRRIYGLVGLAIIIFAILQLTSDQKGGVKTDFGYFVIALIGAAMIVGSLLKSPPRRIGLKGSVTIVGAVLLATCVPPIFMTMFAFVYVFASFEKWGHPLLAALGATLVTIAITAGPALWWFLKRRSVKQAANSSTE